MYFGNIKVSGTAGTYNEYQLDGDLTPDSTDNFTFNASNNQITGGWGTESLSFANAREVTSINGVTTTGLKAVDVTFTMVTPATIQTSTDWWESGYTIWNETSQSSEPITSLNVLRDSMLVTSNWGGDVWINEDFRVKLNGTTTATSGTLTEMVLDGTYGYYTDENGIEKTYEHRVPENEVTDGTWSIKTIDGIEYLVVEVPNEGTTAFKVENSVLMQTELPATGTTETMTWYYGVDLTTFGETVDMISSIDTEMVDGKYEISLLNDISLDLSDLSYSENLLSIDADNGVVNNLTITESDVLSMGNLNELYLDLDALDTFDTAGWTVGSTTDVGGVSYTSYTSTDATIYLNTTTETVL